MSDDVRVPDAITPIRAWRLWRVNNDGVLFSPQRGMEWGSGWLPAVCGRWRCPSPPTLRCYCGFYGLDAPGLAVERGWSAANVINSYVKRHLVLGVVELAGRVIEGTSHGWRAERARVAGLAVDVDLELDGPLRRACERYDARRLTWLRDDDDFVTVTRGLYAAVSLLDRYRRPDKWEDMQWTSDNLPASYSSSWSRYHTINLHYASRYRAMIEQVALGTATETDTAKARNALLGTARNALFGTA